jgi:tripartite-type tricarboxylate transporter receptor subunit TctC
MFAKPNNLLRMPVSIALAAFVAAALPASAQQWEPEYVDGELQPLPSGFPDRPLVIINVDPAGSPDGIYARTLQKIMNSGLSPQRVNVIDRPSTSFGTWEALQFASEEPGGDVGHAMVIHTVPGTVLDLLTVDLEGQLGMGLDDLNVVITTEEIPYVMISRTGAPWGDSYEDMIAYAKEHPGEVRYLSREVGSAVDITMEWLFDKQGVEVDKIIGGSMEEIGIAVAAGEVDVAMVFAEVALTHDQSDRAEVLLMTGDDAIEPWLDKPVMSDVIDSKDVQWGRVIGLAVPSSTPDENREWLAELVRRATEDELYQERGKSLPGRALRMRSHAEAAQLGQQIVDLADPIVRDLGLHHENQ